MKRLLRRLLAAALLLALTFAGWTFVQGNYHTVVNGELYRSGQLSPAQLEQQLRDDHIRSIVNLRGAAPGADWYEGEVAIAAAHGVAHSDVDLASNTPLDLGQMEALVELLRRQPKPLLIHCLGGADRTGLAVALYRYAVRSEPAAQAAEALSLRYGHFPYLFRAEVGAMDVSFRRYITAHPAGPDKH